PGEPTRTRRCSGSPRRRQKNRCLRQLNRYQSMSELSMIAHDYALNADYARKFNDAVLILKRRYLLGRVGSGENEGTVKQARQNLKALLGSLVAALQDEGKPWTADQAQVPAD